MNLRRKVPILILIAFQILPSGANASPRDCAREVLGKLALGREKVAGAAPTGKQIQDAIKESIRKGLKPKVVLLKAGKFFFYPTVMPNRILDTAAKLVAEKGWKGLASVPFEYIRKDGLTAVGFAVFYKTLEGTPIEMADFHFFTKNENGEFLRDTAVPERKDGITVYVDGVPEGNVLYGYGEKDFRTRFEKRDGAVYIHAKDPKDMMKQMEWASAKAGKPIAELEILGHGMPGMMEIGGETLNSESLPSLEGRVVPFAKDALIRIQSCKLGANYRFGLGKPGENFMNGLGTRLLNEGGKVVASNRIIYVTGNFSEKDQKTPDTWVERVVDIYSEPFSFLTHAAFEVLLEQQDPYREVAIPPKR